LHELTLSDQDRLINDHFVGWVEIRNPTAARLAVIDLGFAKLNPTYGTSWWDPSIGTDKKPHRSA